MDKFFDSPKLWSKRKHRLLGKYLLPFSAKVGSWAKLIYCVDGFAGAAKYEDGSAGSPLMMAQLADKCASWRRPVNLRLINVESHPDHFKSLRYITQNWVIDIRNQCKAASVPFFFKQWGGTNKKKAGRVLENRTWDEMPRAVAVA